MRQLAFGALMVAIFSLANVVAAGVFLVLGPLVPALVQDEADQIVPLAIIGTIAVFCAVVFLNGCLRSMVEQLQSPASGHRRG